MMKELIMIIKMMLLPFQLLMDIIWEDMPEKRPIIKVMDQFLD